MGDSLSVALLHALTPAMSAWPFALPWLPQAGAVCACRLAGRAGHRRGRGFTTVELLITLSILGTLTALAAPSLTAALRRTMISSASNDLLGAVNRARTEAQRAGGAGMPFTVCASSQSATPGTASCTGTWEQGVIVFADANGNGARDTGEQVVLALPPTGAGVSVAMKSTLSYVLFAPNGMLHGSEAGVRFTFSHIRAPFDADVQHLCVLRSAVQVVSEAALQNDARNVRCKDL
jgi:prepilin-type N-terminal cleavage/methylation domain-containing protein